MKKKLLHTISFSKSSWPLVIFCFTLVLGLVSIFYVTPLREHIEHKFYDLRIRLKPASQDHQEIAIVEIDQATLDRLRPEKKQDIGFYHLKDLIQKLLELNVKSVAVMLYPNIFDYTDDEAIEFSKSFAKNDRVIFGALGLDTRLPSGRETPKRLLPVDTRLIGMEIFRERRHEFVRKLNFFAYRGTTSRSLLPLYLSDRLGGATKKNSIENFEDQYWLNYIDPNVLYKLSAATLYDEEMKNILQQQLAGRVVFLGYTVFRNRPINSNQIFVNTPWQTEGADPKHGMPLLYVMAMAFINMNQNIWLKESYIFVNVLQSVVVGILSVSIWTLGISSAIVSFLLGWVALLYLHALFFAYGNVIIPLADTAVFSALAVLLGSIWRLQIEGRLNVRKEARTRTLEELAASQSRFLLAFTRQLSHLNQSLIGSVGVLQKKAEGFDLESRIVSKVQASAEDFRDYLKGISEFAHLGDTQARKIKREIIYLSELLGRVVQQFEYRCQEQNVTVDVNVPPETKLFTDETFLEPIIFNLLSNAIKYSPNGSTVRVRLQKPSSKQLVLLVSDEGPGIPPEYHELIFKKFYRVKDAASHKVKGTGIGLYLSRYLAGMLGVQLGIISEPGAGATFSIKFG